MYIAAADPHGSTTTRERRLKKKYYRMSKPLGHAKLVSLLPTAGDGVATIPGYRDTSLMISATHPFCRIRLNLTWNILMKKIHNASFIKKKQLNTRKLF